MIAYYPVFPELLARPDLTRTDVLLYGVLVAFAREASAPSVAELARAIGAHRRSTQRRLRKLEELQLIRCGDRRGRGQRLRVVLLGPRECVRAA